VGNAHWHAHPPEPAVPSPSHLEFQKLIKSEYRKNTAAMAPHCMMCCCSSSTLLKVTDEK
jgi:hypothetical protein